MHKKGVVHRDIKPENIMIENSKSSLSSIKIIDFGTASQFTKEKVTDKDGLLILKTVAMNTQVGTLAYMSPELLIDRNYDEKTDMWSVGILAYVLLCNEMPFEECDTPAKYKKRLKDFVKKSKCGNLEAGH